MDKTASQRLVSLDAFRGATIAGMILVNNPGTWSAVYPQLRHAPWHGWTFTDFVFPFFLWIVGVAVTYSFAKRVEQGGDKKALFLHTLKRALIIFGLGLFLTGFPFGVIGDWNFSWATIRIPGVLQRIAICYLIASAIYLTTTWKGQALWAAFFLVAYWLMTMWIPVPGYGAGILEAKGGLCWYVDSTLLAGHTWRGAPVPGFDPEGIVSTIPAISTALFGVLTGQWLRTNRSREDKVGWMLVAGLACLILGLVLDMWLPINKPIWTSSYAIFMCGWSLLFLGAFYWVIDVKGYSTWAKPFVIYGMNAIAIYVLAGILAKLSFLFKMTAADGSKVTFQKWLFDTVFLPIASPLNASLLYAMAFVGLTFVVAWILWKKKIFIKV